MQYKGPTTTTLKSLIARPLYLPAMRMAYYQLAYTEII